MPLDYGYFSLPRVSSTQSSQLVSPFPSPPPKEHTPPSILTSIRTKQMVMSRLATATTSMPALIARDMAVAVQDTSIRVSMKKKNRPATAWYPVKKQKGESPVNNHMMNSRVVPLDSYTRQANQEERPSLELAGTLHASEAQRALPKDVVRQVPVLDCWCLCPCPRVLQSYDAKHLNQLKFQVAVRYRYRNLAKSEMCWKTTGSMKASILYQSSSN